MMVTARLTHRNGKMMGTKSVPEDCLALRYGGSTFVRTSSVDGANSAIYSMTDTYHFNNLDQE
jgi:hypothetical protein